MIHPSVKAVVWSKLMVGMAIGSPVVWHWAEFYYRVFLRLLPLSPLTPSQGFPIPIERLSWDYRYISLADTARGKKQGQGNFQREAAHCSPERKTIFRPRKFDLTCADLVSLVLWDHRYTFHSEMHRGGKILPFCLRNGFVIGLIWRDIQKRALFFFCKKNRNYVAEIKYQSRWKPTYMGYLRVLFPANKQHTHPTSRETWMWWRRTCPSHWKWSLCTGSSRSRDPCCHTASCVHQSACLPSCWCCTGVCWWCLTTLCAVSTRAACTPP